MLNLNQISKKIGIDLYYFLPRGLSIILRYGATTLIALAISVSFARLTSKEIFGQYQYVLSIVSLLSIFSIPGLNTAALRAVIEGDEQAVTLSARYSFLASLSATVILLILGAYNYFHDQQLLGLALGCAGVFFPFFYAPNNWYVFYEGKLNFRSSTIRLVIANLILLIGMVIGLKVRLNLIGLVSVYFGLSALMTGLFYFEAKREIQPYKGASRLSLRYALQCTVQKFTTTLGENVQTIAVSMLFGFANLAIYQVAQSFVNAFNGLTAALASTYFPLLLKYKRLNHGLILIQHLLLGFVFWGIYLLAVKFFFSPLYGASYQGATNLAHQISFIVIILPLRIYLINFFTARDHNRIVITINIIASIVALLLFIFVRAHGFSFAAVTYLYAVNLLMMAPLLGAYLVLTSKEPT